MSDSTYLEQIVPWSKQYFGQRTLWSSSTLIKQYFDETAWELKAIESP